MAWRPHREPAWRRLLERWGQPRPSMADLADELLEHQYRESLSITTNREPHVTDQPNVEPPELGITLEQARANIGRQVEYVAGDPVAPAYIERGVIRAIPENKARVLVLFDGASGARSTPLDRLRLLPWPEGAASAEVMNRLTGQHEHEGSIAEWALRNEGMDDSTDGPDESYLASLTAALYSQGIEQDEISPSMDEHDAAELAKVALGWMKGKFVAPEPAGPPVVTGGYPAPPPQYAPMPYPMQWGEQPAWGQQSPPLVPAEVPDLIEQREWLTDALPRSAGERVIYRGRPTDPPLLALVVSVQQSPSGVAAVAQYTVRVPYLGQTLGAYADQLATWHEPEPDF